MSNGVQYNIQVVSGNSNTTLQQLSQGISGVTSQTATLTSALNRAGTAAFSFNNISQAFSSFANALDQAAAPGIRLDSSLQDLKAITGATDDQLKLIKQSARDSAKAFGVDAADGVESYKLLLSQLSPELAKTPKELKAMGDNVSILSKQLKGDTVSAAEILTTAMNQYGVDIKDPIQATKTMSSMMNIMSASAKEGSAELPAIKSALENSGMAAKAANVSFAELNGAIQVLDKSGKKGAEGGVAIRNVLAELSQGRFMPQQQQDALAAYGISVEALGDKSKTFQQRLEMLKPIMNDQALVTKIFGKENSNAAIALIQGTDEMGRYTKAITGTNTANEMAGIVMGSYEEKMKRTWATVKNWGISFFDAFRPALPAIQMLGAGVQFASQFGGAMSAVSAIADTKFGQAIGRAATATWGFVKSMAASVWGLIRSAVQFAITGAMMLGGYVVGLVSATAAQLGLNIAMSMNPFGLIVIGIAAAVGAIVLLVKYWDNIKTAIFSFVKFVWHISPFGFIIDVMEKIFPQFKVKMESLWKWIKDKFEALVGWLKDAFGWIKKLFSSDDAKDAAKDSGSSAAAAYADAMQSAIPGIDMPNAAQKNGAITGTLPGGSKELNDSASGISSGGARPTNINITIGKFQDKIEIHSVNVKEGADELVRIIEERLLGVLNSANAIGAR
jgi:TP901 family phage tail tape measure protein